MTIPKSTFFNLSEEKKERIIEAALDEFAEYTYYKSSVTRIVKKADIAKGSFYQYFTDKEDLYEYIIMMISEKKMEYMQDIIDKINELEFFDFLRKLYLAGIKFAQDNPLLNKISNNLYNNTNS